MKWRPDSKNKRYMFRKMIDGELITITASDLAELRKQENDLPCRIDRGNKLNIRNARMTLNAYFDFCKETFAKSGGKATTCTNYESYYNTYIKNTIGKKQITVSPWRWLLPKAEHPSVPLWSEPSFRELITRIVEHLNKEAAENSTEQTENFCPHMVRHTYTSLAYTAGADVKIVSQNLGHASTSVTLDTYTHLTEKSSISSGSIEIYEDNTR